MSETVVVHTHDGDLPVLRIAPTTPNGAGVVVIQEIFGVSEYIVSRCQDLADAGYVVYAPRLYSRLPSAPALDESSPDYIQQGMAASSGLDWHTAATDVIAALGALRREPGVAKVGLLGFCFGGGLAFQVASMSDPDALVAYYGSALPRLVDLSDKVGAPQLHHWGDQDAFISGDDQAAVKEALIASPGSVDWRVYEGAGHAFDNPYPMLHDAAASQAAWPVTLRFLAEHLLDATPGA
jgi:carboxymethylenebutenolidase